MKKLSAFLAFCSTSLCAQQPPTTRKEPVKDTYFDQTVTDDYRWLEDWNNAEVKNWSEAQNAYARKYLDKLPGQEQLRKQVTELLSAETIRHFAFAARPGKFFAMKRQPPKQQPFLVVMPTPFEAEKAKVLVDPVVIDPKGTTAIDWFRPSPDGTLVAVSLSRLGTESGDVHIYNVNTGKEVYEVVPRVNGGTAGGDLVWTRDGKGYYYTRYPRAGEMPEADMDFFQRVYYHELGTPTEKDRYEIGKEFPRIAEIRLEASEFNDELLVSVQDGDSGKFSHYLRLENGEYKKLSSFGEGIFTVVFGKNGDLFIISRKNAFLGKVLRLSQGNFDVGKAETLIEANQANIVTDFYGDNGPTIIPTKTRLYVLYQLGGPSEVRVFDLTGEPLAKPELLPLSNVTQLAPYGDDDLVFVNLSFVKPYGVFMYASEKNNSIKLPLTTEPPVNFDDIKVERQMVTSKDGTKVPVTILTPQGFKKDGSSPALLTGYGGYGLSITPNMRLNYRVLFDRGFAVAVANIRGGGEFGEEWHTNGNLTKKQNVFDDFYAAMSYLVAQKYTSTQRLAIEGGSNGGLLMGAMLTQHPESMKVVITHVGIYDMLRSELSPNGAFNIPEFGTVKIEEQFRALYAYSPYHHVQDQTAYPATLFLTGANDPRVDPMHSRKMTALLQAKNADEKAPILLRTDANAGHGGDSSLGQQIEVLVDSYGFLFNELGLN